MSLHIFKFVYSAGAVDVFLQFCVEHKGGNMVTMLSS